MYPTQTNPSTPPALTPGVGVPTFTGSRPPFAPPGFAAAGAPPGYAQAGAPPGFVAAGAPTFQPAGAPPPFQPTPPPFQPAGTPPPFQPTPPAFQPTPPAFQPAGAPPPFQPAGAPPPFQPAGAPPPFQPAGAPPPFQPAVAPPAAPSALQSQLEAYREYAAGVESQLEGVEDHIGTLFNTLLDRYPDALKRVLLQLMFVLETEGSIMLPEEYREVGREEGRRQGSDPWAEVFPPGWEVEEKKSMKDFRVWAESMIPGFNQGRTGLNQVDTYKQVFLQEWRNKAKLAAQGVVLPQVAAVPKASTQLTADEIAKFIAYTVQIGVNQAGQQVWLHPKAPGAISVEQLKQVLDHLGVPLNPEFLKAKKGVKEPLYNTIQSTVAERMGAGTYSVTVQPGLPSPKKAAAAPAPVFPGQGVPMPGAHGMLAAAAPAGVAAVKRKGATPAVINIPGLSALYAPAAAPVAPPAFQPLQQQVPMSFFEFQRQQQQQQMPPTQPVFQFQQQQQTPPPAVFSHVPPAPVVHSAAPAPAPAPMAAPAPAPAPMAAPAPYVFKPAGPPIFTLQAPGTPTSPTHAPAPAPVVPVAPTSPTHAPAPAPVVPVAPTSPTHAPAPAPAFAVPQNPSELVNTAVPLNEQQAEQETFGDVRDYV